jgi:hypothetical protein
MSFPSSMSLMRHVSLVGCLALVAAGVANAQTTTTSDQSSPAAYSSSQAGLSASGLQLTEFALPESSDPAGSAAEGASAGGQYGGGGSSGKTSFVHNWAFELGGGFNAPVGNDTPYITWGGNINLGAGFRFSKQISALLEYQFLDNKLPGALISEVANEDPSGQVSSGNAHINAITGSPVIDLTPKWSNGLYLVGGFGYYHESINFNGYECCAVSYFGEYPVEVTVASTTSNQWGGNAGFGIYHRLGAMYGGDSHSQIFAEARYMFLHTPPITQSNGFGTTELIPVTLGVRF